MASEFRETRPTFGKDAGCDEQGGQIDISNMSALSSTSFARSWGEAAIIVAVAAVIIGAAELAVIVFDIKPYIFPRPSAIFTALVTNFPTLFWPHMQVTLYEMFVGFGIGASIG